MPQSLAKILVHVVFSTKGRQPFLHDKADRDELHHYIGGILRETECPPVVVGGVSDHVHFLCMLSRVKDLATVIKEVKRSSSLWIKTRGSHLRESAWQNGYGAFSIGFSQLTTVRAYIANQEQHHRKVSFQDEFRQLLRRYEMDYNEKYVWD